MRKLTIYLGIALFFSSTGCRHQEPPPLTRTDISHVIGQMTELMIHDVTNPPLAARFFSYACLAGYEIIAENDTRYKSMHGVLNHYPDLHAPDSVTGYSYRLAAVLAMIATAGKMQPSGALFKAYEQRL